MEKERDRDKKRERERQTEMLTALQWVLAAGRTVCLMASHPQTMTIFFAKIQRLRHSHITCHLTLKKDTRQLVLLIQQLFLNIVFTFQPLNIFDFIFTSISLKSFIKIKHLFYFIIKLHQSSKHLNIFNFPLEDPYSVHVGTCVVLITRLDIPSNLQP